MIPQIEKVKPAGVISVGKAADTSAVFLPPIRVLPPAREFTTITAANAAAFPS